MTGKRGIENISSDNENTDEDNDPRLPPRFRFRREDYLQPPRRAEDFFKNAALDVIVKILKENLNNNEIRSFFQTDKNGAKLRNILDSSPRLNQFTEYHDILPMLLASLDVETRINLFDSNTVFRNRISNSIEKNMDLNILKRAIAFMIRQNLLILKESLGHFQRQLPINYCSDFLKFIFNRGDSVVFSGSYHFGNRAFFSIPKIIRQIWLRRNEPENNFFRLISTVFPELLNANTLFHMYAPFEPVPKKVPALLTFRQFLSNPEEYESIHALIYNDLHVVVPDYTADQYFLATFKNPLNAECCRIMGDLLTENKRNLGRDGPAEIKRRLDTVFNQRELHEFEKMILNLDFAFTDAGESIDYSGWFVTPTVPDQYDIQIHNLNLNLIEFVAQYLTQNFNTLKDTLPLKIQHLLVRVYVMNM
jgi:hypothetical protein